MIGREVNLMRAYPRTKRDPLERAKSKTKEDRAIARQFGEEFFDGDRKNGYGGFNYDPKFWTPVIPDFKSHFDLKAGDKVLDVGCAKGFMLHDLVQLIPGLNISGLDISQYAINNAIEDAKPFLQVGNAQSLPWADDAFDVTISITTIHNLDRDGCIRALQEIERVSRRGSFITVDAYSNELEREAMLAWNLTAKTILHVDDWRSLFEEAGYSGDYYWFKP